MEIGMFEQLEKKIGKLIEDRAGLKEENKKLAEMLKSKNGEIAAFASKLEKMGKDKGLVREKVETLLKRLDGLLQTA